MKCPLCQTEMEKGGLTGEGTKWVASDTLWGKLLPTVLGGTRVFAYRCPKCGKIELISEPQK